MRKLILSILFFILLVGCFVFAAHSTTLSLPANATYTNDNTPNFNFTVVGPENSSYDAELNISGVRYGLINVLNNTEANITANKSVSDGVHSWNIITTNGSFSNASVFRTLTVDTTNPLLSYTTGTPSNGSSLSQTSITVVVSATETNSANVTYELFNSSGLVNSTTFSMASAAANNTITWSSLIEMTYHFNVNILDLAMNSNTTVNRTVILAVAPNVTLESPANSATDTDGTVLFSYNVTDNRNVTNCSLVLNNSLNQTDLAIERNATQNFTVQNVPQSDTLSWYVSCINNMSTVGNSSAFTLDTYAAASNDSSSSSSGSSSSSSGASTYDAGELDSSGYTKTIDKSDRIEFTIGEETYKIKLSFVNDNDSSVKIYLYETVENIDIDEGVKTPVDIDGDGDYDIYITCDDIVDSNTAKISIDLYGIVEEGEEEEETEGTTEDEDEAAAAALALEAAEDSKPWYKKWWIWTLIGVGALVLAGLLWFFLPMMLKGGKKKADKKPEEKKKVYKGKKK